MVRYSASGRDLGLRGRRDLPVAAGLGFMPEGLGFAPAGLAPRGLALAPADLAPPGLVLAG